jgi:hypothetical protein
MILRRATATVLVSIGVAAALFEGCASDPNGSSGTRATATGTGTGNATGSGTGGSTGTGAGGGNSGGGTTTGAGGTIGPINPGNPDASSDMRVMPDASCAGQSTTGEKKQVDFLMMMDNSGSMEMVDTGQTLTRWANLKAAIPLFVNDMANAGMYVGLDFFPEGGNQPLCNATDYANPNVPIDIIPGPNGMQANAIIAAIEGRMTGGGTPTTPALTGAIQAARTWQMAHPERSLSVLFLTDGQPQGCNSSVNNAAQAAQAGTTGTPPIKTYVLGVGPDTGNLQTIAAAGGTMMAYMVTMGGAAELTKALADIRKSTLTCDYNVPKGDGGAVDPTKIVVQVKVGTAGTLVDIPNVVNAQGCAGNPQNQMGLGWYYDNPPPGVPTKITLCPNSCGPLQIADGSEVSIMLGCVPKIIPPPN